MDYDIDEQIKKTKEKRKQLEEDLATLKTKAKELEIKAKNAQKALLEKIKREINAYNHTHSEKILVLVELSKEDLLQYKVKVQEEKQERDVKNLFICLYDGTQINLCEREKVFLDSSEFYTEVELYFNDIKEITGAYAKRCDIEDGEAWVSKGTSFLENHGNIININCTMHEVVRFDTLRYKMKKEGILDNYVAGLASEAEIEEVLDYAKIYFKIEKPKEKVKKEREALL